MKSKKTTAITYVLILFLVFSFYIPVAVYNHTSTSVVQAKDSDESEHEDKEDDHKEDEEKEEEKEKERKEKEKKEEEKRKEDEKKRKEEDFKTDQRITNTDGTETRIRKEVKDGEEKVRIETFNQAGLKIEDNKFEVKRDEDKEDEKEVETKIRQKTYTDTGLKLSDFKLETKEGKLLEIKIQEGTEKSRLKYDPVTGELRIRHQSDDDINHENEVENELEHSVENEIENEDLDTVITAEEDGFEIERNKFKAKANFPITIDEETGNIIVSTSKGQVVLNNMPDAIIEKISGNTPAEVEKIELDESEDGALEYNVKASKKQKFLGFLDINIYNDYKLNAQTGDLIESSKSFVDSLLDLVSF